MPPRLTCQFDINFFSNEEKKYFDFYKIYFYFALAFGNDAI